MLYIHKRIRLGWISIAFYLLGTKFHIEVALSHGWD